MLAHCIAWLLTVFIEQLPSFGIDVKDFTFIEDLNALLKK
jgi:hypothetical protein